MATKIFIVSFERDSKTNVEDYYRILTSALFRDMHILIRNIKLPAILHICIDMHDASQVGSRNFFSYETMINMRL